MEPEAGNLARVEIEPGSVKVEVRSTVELEARLLDEAGNPVGGPDVHWSVEDSKIAEVSQDGVVTGRAVGKTRVAASAQGMDAVANVEVTPRSVIRILVTPPDIDLLEGQTANLRAALLDRSEREIDDRSASWSSTNANVARVDSDGRVTAVRKGSAKIRATADGRTGEAVVNVAARPVDRVEISPSSVTLEIGQNRQFTATARASDGSRLEGRAVAWSSSNTKVVTIGNDGIARAVGEGSANVEARIEGKKASAAVTVRPPAVDRIEISPQSLTLRIGERRQLKATLKAADGSTLTGRTVTWSSSRPLVASVNSNGRVTGLTLGEAVITATSEGKTATAEVRVRNRFGRGSDDD